MLVIREELAPHLDVAVLHSGKLQEQLRLRWVALGAGQLTVQVSGVGLVGEVMEPFVGWGGVVRHGQNDNPWLDFRFLTGSVCGSPRCNEVMPCRIFREP